MRLKFMPRNASTFGISENGVTIARHLKLKLAGLFFDINQRGIGMRVRESGKREQGTLFREALILREALD